MATNHTLVSIDKVSKVYKRDAITIRSSDGIDLKVAGESSSRLMGPSGSGRARSST